MYFNCLCVRNYNGLFFSFVRAQGAIECEHLKNNVTLDCEKTEEKLMHRYVCLICILYMSGWWLQLTNLLVVMSLEFNGRNNLFLLIEIFLGTLVHNFASVSYDNNVGKSSEFQCSSVLQKPCFFPLKFTFEFVSQRQILAMINWLFPRQWIKDHWVQVHTFVHVHLFGMCIHFLTQQNKKEGVICDSI